MVFVLDDRRRDRGKRQHLVNLLLRVIIGDSDRPELAGAHGFFHSPVDAFIIGSRLVDQEQVDIIHVQIFQGVLNDPACTLIVAAVNLGGDEYFFPCDDSLVDRFLKSATDPDFITIVSGRIDQAHPGLQCMVHGLLSLVVGKSPRSKSDHRHLISAV